MTTKVDRRGGKWWLHSSQLWYNIILFIVTVASEISVHLEGVTTPSWFREMLLFTAIIGNAVLRAIPVDNEKLKLRKPESEKTEEEKHEAE